MNPSNLNYNPLYLQVKDILKKEIIDGVYKPGELIPSEAALSKELGISVSTIRQALSILVSEDVLEKKQGKGTFIKKMKISFFTWVGETPRGRTVIRDLVERFEKEYPSLNVDVRPTTHPGALKELLQMISNGQAPDVIQITSFWTSYLASFDALAPLDSLLPETNLKNRFYDKDLVGGTVGDRLYSVSWGLCPLSFIVNKNVLKQAGIDDVPSPMTLDRFMEMCEQIDTKLKSQNVFCYGMSRMNNETDFLNIHTFLQAFGGGYLVGKSKRFLHSDPNIEAFHWLRHFISSRNICRDDIYTLRNKFAQNQIAFLIDGPWIKYILEELTGEEFDKNFKVVLHPVKNSKHSCSYNYSHALAICSQSQNKEAAAKFIDAVTNDEEICKYYLKATGELPTNKEMLDDPDFDSPFYRAFKNQLAHSTMIAAQHAMFEKAMVFCQDAVSKIVFEGMDPEKELKEKEHYLTMLYHG